MYTRQWVHYWLPNLGSDELEKEPHSSLQYKRSITSRATSAHHGSKIVFMNITSFMNGEKLLYSKHYCKIKSNWCFLHVFKKDSTTYMYVIIQTSFSSAHCHFVYSHTRALWVWWKSIRNVHHVVDRQLL